jgi:hypothetical protein
VDYLHAWQPAEFADGIIDYELIYAELASLMDPFAITQFSFDQWNSAGLLDRLKVHATTSPHSYTHPNIEVRDATKKYNPRVAETLKTALSRRLVHAPVHPLTHAELRGLELRNGKVDHPTRRPVTTADLAGCLMAIVYSLLGDGSGHSVHETLAAIGVQGSVSREQEIFAALGNVHPSREAGRSAARGGRFHPPRRW